MALTTAKRYFPLPRPELIERLSAGDAALDVEMRERSHSFVKGTVLVAGDQPHTKIYRLVSGTAARVRVLSDGRRQIICIFLPGDLMAVKAMLLDRQPDSIECLSECRVNSLEANEATHLSSANPDVALRFLWQIAEDERRLHNNIAMLGCGNAIERISLMLTDIAGRLAMLGVQGDKSLQVAMRQQDIADYVGITPVHVSRTMRTLQEQNVVVVKQGMTTVLDFEALGRHAAPLLDIFEREAPEFSGRA